MEKIDSHLRASSSSSTMNLAARMMNSSNSKRPDLSSSTSSIISSKICLLKGCPINLRISATVSVEMDPLFAVSKDSKAFLKTGK